MKQMTAMEDYNLCAICENRKNRKECSGCDIPLACPSYFQPDKEIVVIKTDAGFIPGGNTDE